MHTTRYAIELRQLIAALITLSWAAAIPAQQCDCSCDVYADLMAAVEDFRKQQDAGASPAIPPEMMQMSQCAGQCAMAWAQCADRGLDAEAMQRGADEAHGRPGAPRGTDEPAIADSRLTGDYLEGMWCSVYGGQETAQWVFTDAGDYRVGLPAGNGYAMQPEVRSLEQFRERFERLLEVEPDSFMTEHRAGRRNVFTRGPCD